MRPPGDRDRRSGRGDCFRTGTAEPVVFRRRQPVGGGEQGQERGFLFYYIDTQRHKYQITVQDTGIGLKKEQLEHIFEPYYTTKNTETNFGLGLPYCMKIMRKHAGNIEADTILHGGSRFTLSFPLSIKL